MLDVKVGEEDGHSKKLNMLDVIQKILTMMG